MKNKLGLWTVFLKVGTKVLSVIAKVSKVALVGISFAAYAYIFSWVFAVIIISMLIVHEYGHIWAMQRCGIKTKGIYLIPFVGGLAVSEGMAKSRWDEVFIAMMGPVFGLALSILSLVVYYITQNPLFAATASWMAMVNIFNLFPVTPLDGGRVLKAITLSINNKLGIVYMAVALVLLIVASVMLGWWTFLVLAIIGSLELWFEFMNNRLQKQLDTLEEIKKNDYVPQDLRDKIDEMVSMHRDKTEKMNSKQCFRSMLFYLMVLTALATVMYMMSNVPGAAIAMEMLK